MRKVNDRSTGYLFDPWDYLGEKRRKLLEKSWPGLFKKHCLPLLPVMKIASRFHDHMGRPSKELYMAVGALILQQFLDLSDEEVTHSLAFDIRWHYALDLPNASTDAVYMCPRTVWSFRQMAMEEGLDEAAFEKLTEEILKIFKIDTSRQRIDSTHIHSNMKKLGRVGIFSRTIKSFLIDLQRRFPELFKSSIPEEMRGRYLGEKGSGCFSRVKPSEVDRTLKTLSEDLLYLVEGFLARDEVECLKSFRLLQRVLSEQCKVKGEGEDRKVEVKPAKEIASDSLQNPSDPDATYDGHKGQGYQVQIMETYTPDVTDDGKKDETIPDIITYVNVEPAHVSDAHALQPALESTEQRGCLPNIVLADSSYGSDENVLAAAKKGVEVVSPALGSEKKEGMPGTPPSSCKFQCCVKGLISSAFQNACSSCPRGFVMPHSGILTAIIISISSINAPLGIYACIFLGMLPRRFDLRDFEIDDKRGRILTCPAGQTPSKTMEMDGERMKASFDVKTCQACPFKNQCPTHIGKNSSSLFYTRKQLRLTARRQKEETDEFKDRYRMRAGVEGTMSRYKSQTGAGRLPVRGYEKVRFAEVLKALGLNIFRAAKAMAARIINGMCPEGDAQCPNCGTFSAIISIFICLVLFCARIRQRNAPHSLASV